MAAKTIRVTGSFLARNELGDVVRQTILLVGGDKGGDKRWYKTNVPIADARYTAHLESLGGESWQRRSDWRPWKTSSPS